MKVLGFSGTKLGRNLLFAVAYLIEPPKVTENKYHLELKLFLVILKNEFTSIKYINLFTRTKSPSKSCSKE